MSTVIRNCPGCKTLILSDTDQCPECGHVFYQRRSTPAVAAPQANSPSPSPSRSADVREACPHCGEMVLAGLLRCWSCNGFMRAEIAQRYHDLTTNPQPIIYSTIPPEQRKDFLPPRAASSGGADDEADGFTLSDDVVPQAPRAEFAVQSTSSAPASVAPPEPEAASSASAEGPDKPHSTTPGLAKKSENSGKSTDVPAEKSSLAPQDEPAKEASRSSRPAAPASDDLLSIALQEQRDDRKRRSDRLAERQKKRMMVPCACGAWVGVYEDSAGKSVRCRKCGAAVQVPEIRRKTAEKKDEKPVVQISVAWISDVWFHAIAPGSVTLKPGSAASLHTEADIAISPLGIHIVTFSDGDKKKKSLLSFGGSKGVDRPAQRKQVREQVSSTGEFQNLPGCDVRLIAPALVTDLKLVQPILKIQESMFAGVPIFGEGRIAVFLPLDSDTQNQTYCSFPLSAWRSFSTHLKALFEFVLPASENGVPEAEKIETLSCFVNQSKVESVKALVYYQQDPAFELELTGFRCKSCGTVVSEEGRKKNKLGGANGKGIAKAKCPKCSGKMGEEPLYRIRKAPERSVEPG